VVLHVKCWACRVFTGGQAVKRIVGVSGDYITGVSFADDVASGVIAEGRSAAVRADLLREITETVVLVLGDNTARVFDLGDFILAVIRQGGDTAERVCTADNTIKCVVGIGAAVLLGVSANRRVVVEVVLITAGLPGCTDRT
jgi:hypothetical protein